MRTRIATITFICLCLSSAAFGQSAVLKGMVVDDKEKPVSNVRIIAPDGQADETDSKGQFTIAFPATVQPGQLTRIELRDKPGWAIYEPLLGNCTTQSVARNFEPLKVIIVPKGSILALSPERISRVVARWADERVRLRAQVAEQKSQLDEYAFLREYAEKYGFTLEQFRDAADRWAKLEEADDKEERALKEYWRKNYDSAARLARESGDEAVEELDRVNNERIVVGCNAIRRYRLEGDSFHQQGKLRDAMAAYVKIEKLFSARKIAREDLPEEWGTNKNLLGIMKTFLGGRGEGQESQLLLAEAVAAFREALKVYSREQSPEGWARTQANLGTALAAQGEQAGGEDSVRLLGEAVAAFHEALNAHSREQSPQPWAVAQNNLGNALRSQSEQSIGEKSLRLLAEAVAAFREALKVCSREQSPRLWAMTQNNLGNALRSQGERSVGEESLRLLAEAVAAYREAFKVYSRERLPEDWAMTQTNLGNALRPQGEQSVGEESLRLLAEAVVAQREALKVYSREQSPQQWAATENNLGIALLTQGKRSVGEESLRLLAEAVAAFREALKVYSRERFPQDWAMTQYNLGNALRSQGERSSGKESLRLLAEAVAAQREALKVYSREQSPRLWAMTQANLGKALIGLAERSSGEEGVRLLTEAVAAQREALKAYSREQSPEEWSTAQYNLGVALIWQGELSSGEESVRLLAEAVAACREALKVYSREPSSQRWADAQSNLGVALRSQGERSSGEEGVRLLGEAVTAYREALKVFTREQSPRQWAATQDNLGKAYLLLKSWKDAAPCFENVLTLYPDNEEGYLSLASIYHERLFEYAKAFELHQQWLSRFPQDTSALADFAETHFTTGRFPEFSQRIKPLLTDPERSAGAKIALRMIEVANLLALDNADQVPAALAAILKTVSDQKADFRINWSFSGTLNFINRQEKFASYRPWLDRFFSVAQEENRAAIVKALREAQTQFPAMNSGQRK